MPVIGRTLQDAVAQAVVDQTSIHFLPKKEYTKFVAVILSILNQYFLNFYSLIDSAVDLHKVATNAPTTPHARRYSTLEY